MDETRRKRRSRGWIILGASGILLSGGIALHFLVSSLGADVTSAGLIAAAWLLPVLLVVRRRARSGRPPSITKSDLRYSERSIVEKLQEVRTKQSRHEYHQERSLDRIEQEMHRLAILGPAAPGMSAEKGVDVLFVTSNGAGLGHISRLLAIAGQLPSGRSVEFLTMSTAYRQLAGKGVKISYFPSSDASGEPPETWNPVFRAYFRRLVEQTRPRIIVFDGTWVYSGITDVSRAFGIPLVWVQRGLWKTEVDEASTQRHDAKSVADHVVIPGDYAGREQVELGRGVIAEYVDPIVMTPRESLLARDEACDALGLDPSAKYMLLNLGGGSLGDPTSVANTVVRILSEIAPDIVPVQVVSPLAKESPDDSKVKRVKAYPVMPYCHAFEFTVSAAGYNAVQEAISLAQPTLFVPNAATKTDDQRRRARQVAEQRLALCGESEEELRHCLDLLADSTWCAGLRNTLRSKEEATGAIEAAIVVEHLIEQASWVESATALER